MISRTIFKEIEKSVKSRPVTLITGARQVGKTTLAMQFKEQFNYVSLDSSRERELANKDPELFLSLHKWPLIIDEVQRAPILFDVIEEIVNKEKLTNEHNYGMYILTGTQIYKLMNNITQSLAGRMSIIHIMPLSRNEIINRDEPVFDFNIERIQKRANENPLTPSDLFKNIVKGSYPELYSNELLTTQKFYSDYVETYIEKDVSEIINIKDKFLFRQFMELVASLTGEEVVYDNIAKILGIDKKTVISWLSVLIAADIIYLLEPYNEFSITKRIVKRPKLYFSDTGLACYLAKLNSSEILQSSNSDNSVINKTLATNYFTDKAINYIESEYSNARLTSFPLGTIFNDTNSMERPLTIVSVTDDIVVATGQIVNPSSESIDSDLYPLYIVFKKVDNTYKIDMFE